MDRNIVELGFICPICGASVIVKVPEKVDNPYYVEGKCQFCFCTVPKIWNGTRFF